ncbi:MULTISPECIES: hypothetical protein [unclassified Acinetobacter]|uniref:hypothetical protein n=1 Tax=unclassified Acinetobacter TaxID=196816 RepID=UPI0025771359|nr:MULTISPECIES: hypothetical protein [unclassified Acinetobacter]MDM1758691.1 hypothetical protein [Acinetobacter sp. 256-1]MDM1762342.1 hypothetical protein [Acinetobacter sp. 251-1]
MLNKIMRRHLYFSWIVTFLLSACSGVSSSKPAEMTQVARPTTADMMDNVKQKYELTDACAGIENCTVAVPCEENPHADECYSSPAQPEFPGGDAHVSND